MKAVFYISSHGLGHATRSIELVAELLRRHPRATVTIRTNVRRAAFKRLESPQTTVEPCETDTGIAQIDSLHLDVEETAQRAAIFYRDFDRRIAEEARRLRAAGASIVIGDAPPLASAAAHAAGLPAVVVANFTWDWIYGSYPEFETLAPGV